MIHIISLQDTKKTPVHLACVQGSVDMLKIMFEVQPERKDSSLQIRDVVDHTPLHKAVLFDRCEATEYVLDQVGNLLIQISINFFFQNK